MRRHYIFAAVIAVFSVGLVLLQYILTADVRYDQQTEADLQAIEERINLYAQEEERLPDSVDSLDLGEGVRHRATERGYEYIPQVDESQPLDMSYELCAEFKTDESSDDPLIGDYSFEVHPAGRHCFTRSVFRALDAPDVPHETR